MKALKSGVMVKLRKTEFYVVSRDRFMSGWGGAKDKDNICVVPCDDVETAQLVAAYLAVVRTDQECIRIQRNPPVNGGQVFSDLTDWIATAKRVYPFNRAAMDNYISTNQVR